MRPSTAGAPVALRLTPDRIAISCEYGNLVYVTAEILDQDGGVVTYAEPDVSFEGSGVGELIAVGTANPWSEEPYAGTQRKAWQGRILAVVQSLGQPGEIVLKAQTDKLPASELHLYAKENRYDHS